MVSVDFNTPVGGQEPETEQALFALGVNQSRSLPRASGLRLRIIMGCACVSIGVQEHVLIPGDELELARGEGDATITGMMKRPVVYQFV